MITVVNTNDAGAGSLRQAIADAAPAEVINFDPGVTPIINLTSGELLVNKNLTITGPGSGVLTVRRNAGNFRIFHLSNAPSTITVTITGLTIENGVEAAGNGGGMLCESNLLTTLNDIVFSSNSAFNGGGLYVDSSSTCTATNCSFDTNLSSNNGGGVYCDGGLTITTCTFRDNSITNLDSAGAYGGGIYNLGSIFAITDSQFDDNIASGGSGTGGGSGGAVYNDGTIFMIEGCTFTDNLATGDTGAGAGVGGAISNNLGTLWMSDCTVSGNEARAGSGGGATGAYALGGGLLNNFGTVYIGGDGTQPNTQLGCTFNNNTAQGGAGSTDGGPAWGGGIHNEFGTTYVELSTISNNNAVGGPGTITGGAAYGGGAVDGFASLYLRSSTISGNGAIGGNGGVTDGANLGGGVLIGTAGGQINNVTVTANATGDATGGGGIAILGFLLVLNSIVVGNVGSLDVYTDNGAGGAEFSSVGYNCVGTIDAGYVAAPGTGDQLGVSVPAIDLGVLQDNGGLTFTHAISASSVAKDAGDPTPDPLSPTDQRGFDRFVDGTQDVGAYEVQASATPANWSQTVATPYTGYVYVVDQSGGSYAPSFRYYSGVISNQTEQNFVFWGTDAPTDCPVPTGLVEIGLPLPNDVSRAVYHTPTDTLFYLDDFADVMYRVSATPGTYAGSIDMTDPFGGVSGQSAIVWDTVNDKIVVETWAGSIAFIDPYTFTHTYSNIRVLNEGFHSVATDESGTIYVIDITQHGSLYLISGDTELLIHTKRTQFSTHAICWVPTIDQLFITHDTNGANAFFLYDPATDFMMASVITNPGLVNRYECFFVPETGDVLESYNGGADTAVIDVTDNGTNATIIDTLANVGRVSNATIDTCNDVMFIADGGNITEITLDGSYTTLRTYFDVDPNSLNHVRATNLVYYASFADGTIHTVEATRASGSIGGLDWTVESGVNPPVSGGNGNADGGTIWWSGSAVGDENNLFSTYNPEFDASLTNIDAPYTGHAVTVWHGSIQDSGVIDLPSNIQISVNAGDAGTNFGTTGTNGVFGGTISFDCIIGVGNNDFSVSLSCYTGGNFTADPCNTFMSVSGTTYLTPLTPP